jgi:alkanesulfonate monooxygenase SsuD/methylene tetrahydromethanopterin reductase-like flavin-dependent oxidoreductase (luciferase family)
MPGVNVFAADSDDDARLLASSLRQMFVHLRRGRPIQLPPPDPDFDAQLLPHEQAMLDEALSCSFVGGAETIRRQLAAFIDRTGADELIVGGPIFDRAARLRSFQLLSQLQMPQTR